VFFAKLRTIARWQSALSSASLRTSSGDASLEPGFGIGPPAQAFSWRAARRASGRGFS
jgi:hypothetical protein